MFTLDETERSEWQVKRYDAWQRTAWLCALVANRFRNEKEPAHSMEDFMPKTVILPGETVPTEQEPEKQTWQEQLQIVEILNAAYGGKDTRKKRR